MPRLVIALCILALLLAAVACDWDWDRDADRQDTGQNVTEAIGTASQIQVDALATLVAPFGPQEPTP